MSKWCDSTVLVRTAPGTPHTPSQRHREKAQQHCDSKVLKIQRAERPELILPPKPKHSPCFVRKHRNEMAQKFF